MGMNGMGMNGMGGAMGMNGQMGTSTMNGQRGFLGTTTQGGMVGANTQAAMQGGQTGNQQGMNRNQQGNRNQGRGANRGNNNNQQQQQFTNQGSQRGNSTRSIRPQLKVAFKSPSPISATMQKKLNVRFDGLSKREGMGGVNVDVNGGKVTLRGQVDSEDSRKLAAMLVSLEPGVRSVQNDLTVNPPVPVETE
jgi:osmotically-inducible protein OsmY